MCKQTGSFRLSLRVRASSDAPFCRAFTGAISEQFQSIRPLQGPALQHSQLTSLLSIEI